MSPSGGSERGAPLTCGFLDLPVFGYLTGATALALGRTPRVLHAYNTRRPAPFSLVNHLAPPRRCACITRMSAHPPHPPLQNPIAGTTIDTSPQKLGLVDSQNANAQTSAPTPLSNTVLTASPTRSPSNSKSVLKRTVEQAAGKLGSSMLSSGSRRERSGSGSQGSRLSASLSVASPRRILSRSRKGKDKETLGVAGGDSPSSGQFAPVICGRQWL